MQAESAPAPVRQVQRGPHSLVPDTHHVCVFAQLQFQVKEDLSGLKVIAKVILWSVIPTATSSCLLQADGAFVEAVANKSKSKKERSQNKAVLDVADLFAGWALLFLELLFIFLSSSILSPLPLSNEFHILFSAGPADAARTPRAENRPTRGGSEGPSAFLINSRIVASSFSCHRWLLPRWPRRQVRSACVACSNYPDPLSATLDAADVVAVAAAG